MSDQRDGGIAWTDETWNPIRGCSRVSEGCRHCYAERMAGRFCGPGQPYEGLVRGKHWTGEVRLVAEKLADPLRWRRPRRVFVNSMSDLFHEKLTDGQIAAVFGVMAAAPQHTFQVLTKRAKRMRKWFRWSSDNPRAPCRVSASLYVGRSVECEPFGYAWPLPNVWLGVSCENQATADERIPLLLECPAAVRWVSAEPLLGPIDFDNWVFDRRSAMRRMMDGPAAMSLLQADSYIADALDWVVVGCESGPGARPMDEDWVRATRDQCQGAGVPFFFKQVVRDGKLVKEPKLDGRQHLEMP